ncbi:MAG: hypothetical protein DRK00_08450 [Thermoprotei archaeon]|nr:MAG: hypothetical protein DRK00_08450 [Thermoprotei archaeon]
MLLNQGTRAGAVNGGHLDHKDGLRADEPAGGGRDLVRRVSVESVNHLMSMPQERADRLTRILSGRGLQLEVVDASGGRCFVRVVKPANPSGCPRESLYL